MRRRNSNSLVYFSTFIIFFIIGLFLAAWNQPVSHKVIADWLENEFGVQTSELDAKLPALPKLPKLPKLPELSNILKLSTPKTTSTDARLLKEGVLKVHIIDVGQGDAILVEAPTGETMLIDGGDRSASDKVLRYLKAQGVKKINVLVATHPHTDHIGGLEAVLEKYPVGMVVDSGKAGTSITYRNYLDLIDQKKIPLYLARRGNNVNLAKGIEVEILNPTKGVEDQSMNNSSVVLHLTYHKVSFLFTGDMEADVEKELVKAGLNLQAEVLKVGHHGSDSSTSTIFLGKVSPKYALISVGDNPYGHPTKAVLKRLSDRSINTYATQGVGDIVISTDGEQISVSTGRY